MRILLDTSAYSAFMRSHGEVVSRIKQADEIYFSPIVLGELLAGFAKGKHKNKNEKELEIFLASERVGVLNIDQDTAERYAVIFKTLSDSGTPVPTHDIWIAASAMQHGLRVLTTDTHYKQIPQIISDCFSL